ncbi:tetratricopeptide repeat protein 16 isoform X2 [Tamandua tetradactyla]|uniref:tetratricopeptide repeat protein 16 isoform X2 n=1 Tax=Tamandua tetradactyla TaxID=48850 RepID=UPI0040546C66
MGVSNPKGDAAAHLWDQPGVPGLRRTPTKAQGVNSTSQSQGVLLPRPEEPGKRGLGDGRAVLLPRAPPGPPSDFYALRAEAYIQLCDFSSAAQNLRRAHSFKPENTKYLERLTLVLYLQGQYLFEQCAYLDALNVFSQASELQPKKSCFRYRSMACLLALERYHDCLLLITKELKQGSTNADIYTLRARLYNFLQKPSLCYRDLHSALLLEPKHPQATVLLKMMVEQAQKARQDAGVLAVQGKLQQALQRINWAIENNPLNPSLFLFRGTMYRRLQKFDGAVEDFLKTLDMTPASQNDMVRQAQRQLLLAYNDFAVHCYAQGAYQESVLLLNKALRDEQQEKGLYINRGDCFFQLGNLAFAEADYQQALALSPQDRGAALRLGLLHEKMGFCEQRRRQFQKAENHFSVAIQHNPRKAQYYLHRAKSRQMLQNFFGARQDVATVLLLDPKQPKLTPLMNNLFPGLSVEDVLNSQVVHLARLQLERAEESIPRSTVPQSIMGLLREQELQRQKAHALQYSCKLEKPWFETTEEQEIMPRPLQAVQESPEEEAAAPKEEKREEQKPEPGPGKVTSLSDSYFDQTSSGSAFGFKVTSISETESSTICREYRSTSATAVAFSSSSLLKTQSSDSGINREGPSRRKSPCKTEATQGTQRQMKKAKATRCWRQGSSKAIYAQDHRWGLNRSSSKTKDFYDSSQSSSKTETAQRSSQRPKKTKATQGSSQRPSKTETALRTSQRPSKTEATQGSNQRPSKTESAQDQSQGSSKFKTAQNRDHRPSKAKAAQGQSCGLSQSSSKTKVFCDPSQRSSSKTETIQGLSWRPSKAKAVQDHSQRSSEAEVADGRSQGPFKAENAQGWSLRQSQSSSKTKDAQDSSQSPSKMEAFHDPGQRPTKIKVTEGPSQSPSLAKAAQSQRQSQRPSKTEVTWGPSRNPRRTEASRHHDIQEAFLHDARVPKAICRKGQIERSCTPQPQRSLSPSKTEASQSWSLSTSQSPGKTEAAQYHSPSRSAVP